MTFPVSMWVNERTNAEFKLLVGAPSGFMAPPSRQDHLVSVPGRMGSIRVSKETEHPPRRFTVEAAMRADSQAERDSLWDQFTQHLGSEELEIRFATWPNAVGHARFESMTPGWREGPHQGQRFTMSFVMPNPLKVAKYFDTYTIPNGTEVALILGNASSDVHLKIVSAGLTGPQVFYKDAQGVIHGDVSFALNATSFPSLQWLDVNWDGYWLARRYSANGTVVTDDANMVPTRLFVADPNDGDATQGPTLTAVNAHVIAEVRNAWL
jgi:hypothetical protein